MRAGILEPLEIVKRNGYHATSLSDEAASSLAMVGCKNMFPFLEDRIWQNLE